MQDVYETATTMPIPGTVLEQTQNSYQTRTISKGIVLHLSYLEFQERNKVFSSLGESSPGVVTICVHKMAGTIRKSLKEPPQNQSPPTGEVFRVSRGQCSGRMWLPNCRLLTTGLVGWETGFPQVFFPVRRWQNQTVKQLGGSHGEGRKEIVKLKKVHRCVKLR